MNAKERKTEMGKQGKVVISDKMEMSQWTN